jgi:hypothetical protein
MGLTGAFSGVRACTPFSAQIRASTQAGAGLDSGQRLMPPSDSHIMTLHRNDDDGSADTQ